MGLPSPRKLPTSLSLLSLSSAALLLGCAHPLEMSALPVFLSATTPPPKTLHLLSSVSGKRKRKKNSIISLGTILLLAFL